MKRYACCYLRYSSDKQQQQSIEYQLDKIKLFCAKHQIILRDEYKDQAITGTSDARQSFQQMIKDSEYKAWDYLIVYNLSRLARNVEDQMFYQKLLRQKGIMVISVEEKFDASPEGDLFNLITAGMNEYYSKNLAKRSFGGVLQNANRAQVIGGMPPLGYDVSKDKYYIINKKEAEAVKIIFNQFVEGWSYQKISKHLNELGYLTKKGRKFAGHLYDILTNRKYIGEYIFNKTSKNKSRGARKLRDKNEDDIIRIKGGMPQIIDPHTFHKAQHIIKYRKTISNRGLEATKYLLTGLIECEKCGFAYTGNSTFQHSMSKPRFIYRHARSKRANCYQKDVPVQYLDQWVIEACIPELLHTKNIKTLQSSINEDIMRQKRKIKDELEIDEARIQDIKKDIQEKTSEIAESKFTLFVLEEIKALKIEYDYLLRAHKDKVNREEVLHKITLSDLNTFIQERKKAWKMVHDQEGQGAFIARTIGKIMITSDEVKVYLSYDVLANELTAIYIEVASIKRKVLMTKWRDISQGIKRVIR